MLLLLCLHIHKKCKLITFISSFISIIIYFIIWLSCSAACCYLYGFIPPPFMTWSIPTDFILLARSSLVLVFHNTSMEPAPTPSLSEHCLFFNSGISYSLFRLQVWHILIIKEKKLNISIRIMVCPSVLSNLLIFHDSTIWIDNNFYWLYFVVWYEYKEVLETEIVLFFIDKLQWRH